MRALSIVAPGGRKIASLRKTIEVRSWVPRGLAPDEDLLIVENLRYLHGEDEEDPESQAVAIVKLGRIRVFADTDLEAAAARSWTPGYFSWELQDVRAVSYTRLLRAARGIYELELDRTQLIPSTGPGLRFDPLCKGDLPLLKRWVSEPRLQEYWPDTSDLEELRPPGSVEQFLIRLERLPIGYAQIYQAAKVGNGWWNGIDEFTWGFDLFIGPVNLHGRGLGRSIIQALSEKIFAEKAACRVIADPKPGNAPMLRSLERAGFSDRGPIETPDGTARLFQLHRPTG